MAALEGGDGDALGEAGGGSGQGDVVVGDGEEVGVGDREGGGEVVRQAEVEAQREDGGKRERLGAGEEEEAGEAEVRVERGGAGEAAEEDVRGRREGEGREGREARVQGLREEGGVAAEEAEHGHGEAKRLLKAREGARRHGRRRREAREVVEQQAGRPDGGRAGDDVVQAPVLHPLEPHLLHSCGGEGRWPRGGSGGGAGRWRSGRSKRRRGARAARRIAEGGRGEAGRLGQCSSRSFWAFALMGFYQKKAESPNQTTLKSAPLSRDLPALGPQTAVRASSFASSNVTHLPTQPEVNSWDRTMLGPYVMKETHQCVGVGLPVVAGKKEFEANPSQGAGSNALYCPRDRWLQL